MNFFRILVVSAFSSMVWGACAPGEESPESSSVNEAAGFNEEQKLLADVRTGSLEYKPMSMVVSCTGEIEVPPQGIASVTAPLGGYIVETEMVPGTFVKKGVRLATLSNPEYVVLQQSYLETVGQLTFAEAEYRRQQMLEEQNATALKKLQESESSFNVLRARLAGLKEQLRMIGINFRDLEGGHIQSEIFLRAPLAGYVTNVNHHPGQFVEPKEIIFEIVSMKELHLHLNVFEQDVPRIHKGQSIRFRPPGEGGDVYWGEVMLVSPQRNEAVRTFDVHGHIEKENDKLKPGMYVEAEIFLSGDSVYALPQRAIVKSGDSAFIVTEDKGSYTAERVQTGSTMDGWVEIKEADRLRDKRIVIDGATRLFAAMGRR
jgi:cobalt-zinc-cadmium efflux system membrane fusion protein